VPKRRDVPAARSVQLGNPNIPKITACMIKHRSDLSSNCRTVMDRDLAAKGRKVAVQ
jgi:hypothetical protein